MSRDDDKSTPSLIEAAMNRAAGRTMAADTQPAAAGAAAGTGSDRDAALARRLGEIRSALGEDPLAAVPAVAEIAREPLAPAPSGAPSVRPAGAYGPGAMVLTAGLAALAGAGAMWLALRGADTGSPPAARRPAAVVAPLPATAALPLPAAPPASVVNEDEAQARELIERWRKAWAGRDIEAYLGCYGAEFVPASGQARSSWAAARRAKLSAAAEISVLINDVRIERIDRRQLRVSVLQDYAAGSYREVARPKTLLLVRDGGAWLIAGEWQGGQAPAAAARK